MAELEKGYTIALDTQQNILKFRLWGMWDQKLAQQFEKEIKAKILEISQHAPQGWFSLIDLSQFPPQLKDIQDMATDVMGFEITHGMKKSATLVAQTMTKLQIRRLATQQGFDPGSFFQSEDEARRWLLQP